MFTGIVQEVGKIKAKEQFCLQIKAAKSLQSAKVGDSISVNGACLTITGINGDSFFVDVTPETQKRTNLGSLKVGDLVNLEPALSLGQPLGGHIVQGHIDGTGKILSMKIEGNSTLVTIQTSPEIMKYLVEKGFIAIDGISFTIVSLTEDSFVVSLIPFTKNNTTMASRKVGDKVNLEVDIIAKYVQRLVNPYKN